MLIVKRSTIIIAVALTAALLAGCRGEEERSYVSDKGNYTGQADTPLTQAQLSELIDRAALQGTANVSGGAARRPAEERPAPPTSAALGKRLQEQSGH